jgi:3-hydroxyacyl-CoA dehydrogenase
MAVIVDIKTFAAIGAGVIGSGWVTRALAHGLDVVAWDPAPGAEKPLRNNVANAWPALARVGLAPGRRRIVCGLLVPLRNAWRRRISFRKAHPNVKS